MKVRSKIFKRKSRAKNAKGQLDHRLGKWVLRVQYFDEEAGAWKTKEKQFSQRHEAVDARPQIEADLKKTGGKITVGEKMTFDDLAAIALKRFYRKAVIDAQGYKREGIRSHKVVEGFITRLKKYFGAKRIGSITRADLEAYSEWRFNLGSQRGKTPGATPVSQTTINRELSAMRKMMRYAYHEGWTTRDVFAGAKVIKIDREQERKTRLTPAQEDLLLSSCQGRREITYKRQRNGIEETINTTSDVNNPYLKAIVLLALDSAMRKGEILQLTWPQIHLDDRYIVVTGTHTKTETERLVPLTDRTADELRRLQTFGGKGKVFPFQDFKRSWHTAKTVAGLTDLHFHDLRRTAITKLNLRGVPMAVAGKIAGHARLETTQKHYVASDIDIVQGVADTLNAERNGVIQTESVN